MGHQVLVKKYGNRRLYDTAQSRYITLDDLAALIRRGDAEEVRVVSAKDGEDLTRATLTQIIVESPGAAQLLPVPMLIEMIRMGETGLAEFVGKYVTWAFQVFLQTKKGVRAIAPFAPFLGGSALAHVFGFPAADGEAEPKAPPEPPARPEGAGSTAAPGSPPSRGNASRRRH